jgi:hypothetical protein
MYVDPGTGSVISGSVLAASSADGVRDAGLATDAAAAQNGFNVAAGQARIGGDTFAEARNTSSAIYQLGLYNYYMGYSETMPIDAPSATQIVAPPIQVTLP